MFHKMLFPLTHYCWSIARRLFVAKNINRVLLGVLTHGGNTISHVPVIFSQFWHGLISPTVNKNSCHSIHFVVNQMRSQRPAYLLCWGGGDVSIQITNSSWIHTVESCLYFTMLKLLILEIIDKFFVNLQLILWNKNIWQELFMAISVPRANRLPFIHVCDCWTFRRQSTCL